MPSKRLFPRSCVSAGSSMVISSKRAYAIPKSAALRAPVSVADHRQSVPPQETIKHSSASVSGFPGFWCVQGLFEPSERLWWEWGLSLNLNLPLLRYCWCFPFAIGCGVSPNSHSSTYRLPGVFLTLKWDISPQSLNTAVWCCSATQPPLTDHTSEQDTVFPSLSLSHQEASISFFFNRQRAE